VKVELLRFEGWNCEVANRFCNVEVYDDSVIIRRKLGEVVAFIVVKEDGSIEVFSLVGDVKVAKKKTIKVDKYGEEWIKCKGVRLEFETKKR